jgi:hypothetical protein
MTAPIRKQQLRIDPREVFVARAEARALLWQAGEFDLHTAVDELQAHAEREGLVAEIGQDAVQAIMATAFAVVRDDQVGDTENVTTLIEEGGDYDGLSIAAACRKADEKRRSQPPDPRIEKLRRLKANDVSIERAYAEINERNGAAASTIEALMLGLRERGTSALRELKLRGRLAQLSEMQLVEVGDRLQKLKPEIARAWSADEIGTLVSAWEEAR